MGRVLSLIKRRQLGMITAATVELRPARAPLGSFAEFWCCYDLLAPSVNNKPRHFIALHQGKLFFSCFWGKCWISNWRVIASRERGQRWKKWPHSKNKTPVSGREFFTVLGVKLKWQWYVFWLFFKIGLCSATSMESSRRDLLNDVADHRSILKNNQNTYYPVLVSHPKQV